MLANTHTHHHMFTSMLTVTHTVPHTHKHIQSHSQAHFYHVNTRSALASPFATTVSSLHTHPCTDARLPPACLCQPLLWPQICPGGRGGSLQFPADRSSARVSFHSCPLACTADLSSGIPGRPGSWRGGWRWPCPCAGLRAALLLPSGWTSHRGARSEPGGPARRWQVGL